MANGDPVWVDPDLNITFSPIGWVSLVEICLVNNCGSGKVVLADNSEIVSVIIKIRITRLKDCQGRIVSYC